jgi:hypothetical protein
MAWCSIYKKHRDDFTFTFTSLQRHLVFQLPNLTSIFRCWGRSKEPSVMMREPHSSVSIMTRLRTGRPGFYSRHGQGSYLFATNSVGTALGYGLDNRGSRVRFPAEAGNFSLHHRVQNGSGAHIASCTMATRGFFPGGKAAWAWMWPLTPT